ncbi:hypothetical protein ECEC1862_2293, partial [Escherichia coli EC1862]
SVARRITW